MSGCGINQMGVVIIHGSEVGLLPIQDNDVCFLPRFERTDFIFEAQNSASLIVASLTTVLASMRDGSFRTSL